MSARVTDFSIEVPAKWVLSGEHSVLRGKSAIAFCYPSFSLKLSYSEQESLSITPNPFQSQIKQLIGRALEYLKYPESTFAGGKIEIESEIPVGAGLGSSAAVSVAIARLVLWKTKSDLAQWIPLATHLEDLFHGKSSGMDVSAIAQSHPILFSMAEKGRALAHFKKLPRFELYDSGKRGQTKECIELVKKWRENHVERADQLDDQMQAATNAALEGLRIYQNDSQSGEKILASAMTEAQSCLETWGLVSPELVSQKQDLLKQGALAVKLTGAGLGGFWVALWPSSTSLDNSN